MTDSSITKATLYWQQKRYQEAEKVLRQLLGQQPDHLEALVLLASCEVSLDKKEEALATIRRALALNPDNDYLRFRYAHILYLCEQEEEAVKQLEEAIQMNPTEAAYFGLLAELLLHMKKYEEALANANRGLELDPENSFCLNVRASALMKLKQTDAAFETLFASLNKDPENSYTHANYGWSKLEKGDHKEAKEHFREALRLDPNNAYARNGMVEAIKAKNLFYRLFLRYVFWMNRMSAKYQWGFIIGIYLLFQVLQGLAERTPALQPLLLPLIYIYLIFALSTWFMEPLANLFLLTNAYGRYALPSKERKSAMLVGGALLLSITSLIIFFSTQNDAFMATAFFFFGMMIPMASMLRPQKEKARKQLVGYTVGLTLVGLLALVPMWQSGQLQFGLFSTVFLFGLFAYQWFANAKMGSKY